MIRDTIVSTTYFPDTDKVQFMHKESGVGVSIAFDDLVKDIELIRKIRDAVQ